jgi:glycosyltransferase involved in cell wall biosynthesis
MKPARPLRPGSARLRVLLLGPVNTPHTEALAIGAHERGFDVVVAGDDWGLMPDSALQGHGIEVSYRGRPTARWLRALLDRVRPDVVHANWFTDAFVYLLYGAVPMIAMAWGSDIYQVGRVGRAKNGYVARFAGMVMADSSDLLDHLIALGASPDRAILLNWGIDLDTFSPPRASRAPLRRRLGLPDGRLILSPRGLKSIYNPRTIIEAFDFVADERPDVHLLLKHIDQGDPDLADSRHADRIHTIGYVPYVRMTDYYRASDVCVSVPSSDSSPRSVWEAMGCGCPCVLSDLPWTHELIRRDHDALLAPVKAQAIAASIARLLDNPNLAANIAANARVLVEQHRDREKELDRLAAVYHRLDAERPGTSSAARALHASAACVGEAVGVGRRRLTRPALRRFERPETR